MARGSPATFLPWEPLETHIAGDQSEVCSYAKPAQPIKLKRPKVSLTVPCQHTSRLDEGRTLERGAPFSTKPASSFPNQPTGDNPKPPGTHATGTRCAGAARWMRGGGGTPQQTIFPCLSSKIHFSCLLTAPVGWKLPVSEGAFLLLLALWPKYH